MSYFAFTPSPHLQQQIQHIFNQRHHSEALYPLRNALILQMNDEIVAQLLTGLIQRLPASEKRNIAEKLAHTVQSTVHTLLNQLLGKADNDTVQQSLAFVERSQFQGTQAIGFHLPADFVAQMLQFYQQILQEQSVDVSALAQHYKTFASALIQHFMIDFNHTLGLGLIKRKASDLAAATVIKAVHLAIDKIIPHLQHDELKILANYHQQFFVQA
ncbi:MAG: hypothetical protein Q4D05_02825 [Acinetobacter sp.]|nr:hypothetical protein [Acinetobacter sp.]